MHKKVCITPSQSERNESFKRHITVSQSIIKSEVAFSNCLQEKQYYRSKLRALT